MRDEECFNRDATVRQCGLSETLRAVLDRLIPSDDAPGALECDIEQTVRARVDGLDRLLERLKGFANLDSNRQDGRLRELEERREATFSRLVDVAHEAFYSDPRSWPALGYSTGVPGQP